ncbi:glycosyl hydrolase family 79 C-terminal domain-containing protein [Conexibacter sp. DBS9H8]|uniref:glycosyl hydrolase family 79 C-terminal domain-containing protein n=1 Tax=Conexibacter sp. DBS9H8 TaxID=2937801 RepID=UPI00200D92C6|nr:glycosyl hydrolase family 79 C-terminal domain-containing protein [Conexibacter sp. DBS9H8]
MVIDRVHGGHRRAGYRWRVLGATLTGVAVGLLGLTPSAGAHPARGASLSAAEVTVGQPLAAPPVPASMIGVSIEYYAVAETLGASPAHVNPIFTALIHQLSTEPSIRIGGESADWSYVPAPGLHPPRPVVFSIRPAFSSVLAATARQVNARYLLDLNLAADNPRLAAVEARTLVDGIGPQYVRALEIGNEPELYSTLAWSRPPLPKIFARPPGYTPADYIAQFNQFAAGLPSVATAGPASGSPAWVEALAAARSRADRLSLLTLHEYALRRCGVPPTSPEYPTVTALARPATAADLTANVGPALAAARARHLPLRVDEIGDAACFGVAGVSNSFADALFALQASYDLARAGVGGINFDTVPAAAHRLFNFWQVHGVWHASVSPIYYGLLMFNWAAPAGSRLLATTGSSATLSTYASETPTDLRVLIVNPDGARTVTVRAGISTTHAAALVGLRAPSAGATGGVTIAGQRFSPATTTGTLTGTPQATSLTPTSPGTYTVTMPAHSAWLLEVPRG